jgi:DNA-binding MarR family transcriptional regulator
VDDVRLVEAIERLMRAAVGVTTRALTESGAGTDLTLQQWRALAVAVESGSAGVRVGDLGRRLGMAMPGASRLVSRLERRDLISVTRDADDRRVALVRATDTGHEVWAGVVRHRRVLISAALNTLDAGPGAGTAELVETLVTAFAEEI